MKFTKLVLHRVSWTSLFLVTIVAAYLLIFNEWLFAVTKPSFINGLRFGQQFQIYIVLSALLACICLACLLPLKGLCLFPTIKKYSTILVMIGGMLPAVISAVLILLMVDNFTYTLFKFGIASTVGLVRGLYGLGFILLTILCYLRILKVLANLDQQKHIPEMNKKRIFIILGFVLLLPVTILAIPQNTVTSSLFTNDSLNEKQLPNIVLITGDGLEADHMSVYGYTRDTTPNLRGLAESALIAENAFSNSDHTTGSIISIYTAKYPTKTRVLIPPDILQGIDSYEHLPGILRAQGYKTIQITYPYYADANDLNLLNGFDRVRTRSSLHTEYLSTMVKVFPRDKALFFDEIIKRVVDRIRHIFFIWKMANPYQIMTGMTDPQGDIERLEVLRQEIQTTTLPIFAHIHLMVTHGPKYYPSEQKYSISQATWSQKLWNDDFYDDSILDFDKRVGELVDYLNNLDLLDKTILIIGSDHARKYDLLKTLPLIIRFPNGQYIGKIQSNVQNLDIAPTILDYIGINVPEWMRGNSIINELKQRPIFGAAILFEKSNDQFIEASRDKTVAPFYYFGKITMVYCQKWFELSLSPIGWKSGDLVSSTSGCTPGRDITDEQAFNWIVAHLQENGFDVSSLTNVPQNND